MASIHDLYKKKLSGIENIQSAAAEMIGKTIVAIQQVDSDQLHFEFNDGTSAVLENLDGKIAFMTDHDDKDLNGLKRSEANDYY
ncbi:MAG: hypothetical protein ACOYEJ_10095 [Mahellales bacterium]